MVNKSHAVALALFCGLWGANPCQAADYPARPIRVITGYAQGASADLGGRLFVEKLAARLNQAVIVENRVGVNEILALNAVAAAAPDGYTLIHTSSSVEMLPALMKAFPFELTKDFVPITTFAVGSTYSLVNVNSSARSLDDLVVQAKKSPGKLNFTAGTGYERLLTEFFKVLTGTVFEIIPYKGSPTSLMALRSGESHVALGVSFPAAKPQVDSGALRFIASTGKKRSAFTPDVPTMTESALPEIRELGGVITGFWLGPMAPAKTSPEIIDLIYRATREIVKDPDFAKRILGLGLEVETNPPTPEAHASALGSNVSNIVRLARRAGIEPQ